MERVLEGEEKKKVLKEALKMQGFSEEDIEAMLNQKSRRDKNMNYINSHAVNREVFEDTLKMIVESDELLEAVRTSAEKQFVWRQGEDFPVKTEEREKNRETKIVVSGKRTFEAAQPYSKAGKKTVVLNFANNHNPGGGVVHGANAQEECLCRCSTLYSCITRKEILENFYEYHTDLFNKKSMDFTGNDDLIYSPDVVVCKTDTPVPERMDKKDWYKVDVITCAAPNLRGLWFEEEEEYRIHLCRFTAILEVAKNMGAEVLILGAFGCGAFGNNPEIVSHGAHDALKQYEGIFDTVEFAVFATERDKRNYEEFCKAFCN